MYEAFNKGNLKLELGVRFDGQTEKLLAYAKDFAEKTDATLRLAHAVEPYVEQPWIHSHALGAYTGSMVYENLQNTKQEATDHLGQLVNGLGLKKVETNVAIGDVSDVLQADAVAAGCSMILVSSSREGKDYKLLPSGLSTALKLMHTAKVPVVVVPGTRQQFKAGERLKVLYMDDLSEQSRGALHLALEMATGFGDVDFLHMNVCPTSRKEMEKAKS